MFRYQYFIKKTQVPYTFLKKFQCIRVSEGDKHIPELTEKFKQIGWTHFISYSYKPTKEEEIFKLKLQFRAWDDAFKIESLDTKKMK